ncbi:multidrug effflux MFS transporter [Kumtagia ephedrae]|uniref:Bcr/CflA family efflux transporter n=1 Tax=Kumtagia ephedrae TaxID=2116701 RepID=A0A2P7S8B2_9HYPH|nr:multidrug effflux MFS transporter [Mesorhizobium ephedrae]PSJ58729.1 Bcr/CflA family drug resistance efflux transporter [Mesorhizobium ephedrae]
MNMQSRIATTPAMSERRVGLLGALLIAIGPVSMALYTPAMPEIVRAFGTTEAAVKLTLSVYFAGFAVAQLVCGPLSDGFGRKPVTYAFMGIYLVASLLALLAPTVDLLILARLLQGVGAAVGSSIARAVVRDLFTNERSARIMNLMGLILAVGPAFSPTLGGITMELAGWHAIFVLMVVAAVAIMLVVRFAMVETVERDLSRIRPRALLASYREVLATPYFVLASIVLAGTVGAIYTQATILPFILMDRVGLSPSQFGAGMLMQSGFYFAGSLVVRQSLGRHGALALVPVGLAFVAIGSAALAIVLRVHEASFLGVMGPVAFSAFGIAFIMPAMATATLAPFPHIAGAASSMSGFFQMGGGLLGGLACAALGEPVFAMATVIPAMGFVAILAWAGWRRLPKPAAAGIVHPAPPPEAGQ